MNPNMYMNDPPEDNGWEKFRNICYVLLFLLVLLLIISGIKQ